MTTVKTTTNREEAETARECGLRVFEKLTGFCGLVTWRLLGEIGEQPSPCYNCTENRCTFICTDEFEIIDDKGGVK